MKKPPSDVKFLRMIYKIYLKDFLKYDEDNSIRSHKNYVPIDAKLIGKKLGYDPELVFGRLYYHFENKYGYKNESGDKVYFFALNVNDPHCIHFPYLASILAGMEEDASKFKMATTISVFAIVISVITATITLTTGG